MNQNISPAEAITRLKEGNQRFVSGVKSIHTLATHTQREHLAEKGQRPFAIVLGCADSRAPAELVFDAGLGDLFVVRVAGNIVAPSLLGSIEFAATNFGTPLCIVLGHSRCGAVAATTDLVKTKKRAPTDHIHDIVLEIEPSVKLAISGKPQLADRNLVEEAARMNVAHSMQRLTERSSVLSNLVSAGQFKIIGGIYDLHSGEVSFID
jgi:carbonic anhydrase